MELMPALVLLEVTARRAWSRWRADQRGEGVVSVAIAVLIMAFLGAAMYVAFSKTLNKAEKKTDDQVCSIGSDQPQNANGGSPCP